MQIDFHHAVTYVAARIAGFSHDEADIISYSAQYVDDATSNGEVLFSNKAMYMRISSAHKVLDLRNLDDIKNHLVWIPFHFLPGNGNMAAGKDPAGSFINKIVCSPDSPVAQDMVRDAILDQGEPYSLYRLGITMHVYADTWAHQGFAGVMHEINEVENAVDTGKSGVFDSGLADFLSGILDDAAPPLGHGRANVLPDIPFLSWQYQNGRSDIVNRPNTDDFCRAADAMCRAMQRYRLKDPDASVSGIGSGDMKIIRGLFNGLKDADGNRRHQKWLEALRGGPFSFGSAVISYDGRGANSWKARALGTSFDIPVYTYDPSFLTSSWKMFHDALQLHRLTVVHDILPRYGICAA